MKELGRDVVVYGLGEGSVRALGLISVAVLTNLLTPADYGAVSIAMTVCTLFAAIVGIGGESTYARWFFDHESLEERAATTSTWLAGVGAAAILGAGAAIALLPAATALFPLGRDLAILIGIGLATVPLTLLNGICGQALRNRFRAGQFIALSFATGVVGLTFTIVAVAAFHLGALGVLVAGLATALFLFPLRLYSVRDLLVRRFDAVRFRAMARYGFGIVAAGLCYVVMGLTDRWMIAALRTIDEVGYYSLALNIVSVMLVFLAAFGQAWSPRFFQALTGDPAGAPRLAARILTLTVAAFAALAVAVSAFAHPLMKLVIGADFAPAIHAVGPLALGTVAYASTQVTAIGVSVRKRAGLLTAAAAIAATSNVALNALLIPVAGYVGAAWATGLSYVVLTLAYGAMTQRLWPIPYETTRIAAALAVCGAGVYLAGRLADATVLLSVLLATALSVAVAVVLASVCGVSLVAFTRNLQGLLASRSGG